MTAANPPRRHLLKSLAAAGLLTGIERLGLIRAALAAGANPVPPGLHRLRGAVTLNGQPAREGQLVRPGDTVATGPGAEALYVIGEDAFLQRESSTVRFGADMANFMRVVSGKILSVFGRGQRNITVATATIGIRGTACYIEQPGAGEKVGDAGARSRGPACGDATVEADAATAISKSDVAHPARGRSAPTAWGPLHCERSPGGTAPTYFCLCYGEARVTPTAAPQLGETVITTHHDHPLWIHDDMKMPTMMVSAEVINHTDAELTMLENLVGRRPPFSSGY